MLKKAVVAAIVVAMIIAGIIMYYQRDRTRLILAMRPEHRDRYYDPEAILDVTLKMEKPNATASGFVVNNTWKVRNVAVWVGFVKPDGFHEGSTVGRNYYGYQYFPQVAPKEKKPFSVTFAVPPMNRSWTAVAEFDPKEERLRPIWAPQ